MTATLHRLGMGRDAGLYYTNDPAREARSRNRDEYYVQDGGGVWWSSGQSVVTHGAAIELTSFRDLCAGVHPGTGKALVRGAGENHRAGIDVTFTPGKSVSVLWMSGTPAQRELIETAHRAAVDRALKFVLEEQLVVVRHGAGGIHRDRPSDLIVGRFDHFTTRLGDPNVHSHCVILNVAANPGVSSRYGTKHLTTETAELHSWQLGLGAVYRAALAEQLKPAGFAFRPAGRNQWEIAGMPQELLEVFSKRSHQIEERVGRSASAAQKEIAALATRGAKETVLTGPALESHWQSELAQTGLQPWLLAQAVERDLSTTIDIVVEPELFVEPPAIVGQSPVALAASMLLRTEGVLDRQRLLTEAMVQAGLQGVGPDAVYRELAALEQAGVLLRLDAGHWTTPAMAALEAGMIRAAMRPAEREWITADAMTAALEHASHLSEEQSLAVLSAARADGVTLIEAAAGTGKTTLAKAIIHAAELSGLTIVGLAPSWIAADELGKSINISAQAIARWRYDRANGTGPLLDANTVLVVDEAGMVGTADMAAILNAAKDTQAKVILLGDRRQLQSVAGASALAAIADVVEQGAVLDNVRRQRIDWQRAASVMMARGNAEAGLRVYASHDRLKLVQGEAAAHAQVIALWNAARQRHGDDVLIITRRNIDAVALNTEARLVLRQAGRLGQADVIVPAIGRDQKRGELKISIGDRIRFGETLNQFDVRNGSRAVVKAISSDDEGSVRIQLGLEDGRIIAAPWSELVQLRRGQEQTLPRISHGYAGTAYAAQGRTAAATVLHIARQTDAREIYVALTRHQHDVQIVVEADRLDAACRQRQVDSRVPPTAIAMRERLFTEAAQYREKANVVDHVADRAAFVATGLVDVRPSVSRWNVLKSLDAARQLRGLLQTAADILRTRDWLHRGSPRPDIRLPAYFRRLDRTVRGQAHNIGQTRGPDFER